MARIYCGSLSYSAFKDLVNYVKESDVAILWGFTCVVYTEHTIIILNFIVWKIPSWYRDITVFVICEGWEESSKECFFIVLPRLRGQSHSRTLNLSEEVETALVSFQLACVLLLQFFQNSRDPSFLFSTLAWPACSLHFQKFSYSDWAQI